MANIKYLTKKEKCVILIYKFIAFSYHNKILINMIQG
jgi:hypothetical protein